MNEEKVHFERGNVYIHERPAIDPKGTALDEIGGTIYLVENERGKFLRFTPLGLENINHAVTDEWAMVNGHSVVSYNKSGNPDAESLSFNNSPLLKYRLQFNLQDLRSIRRHHMLHGIAHMIFILKDGTTLPAFYFHLGGSKNLLQQIAQYLRLDKSAQDGRLYIVKDDILPQRKENAQNISTFDQLHLFDNSNDNLRRFKLGHDSKRSAMERFSKVTHFLRDAFLGPNEFISTGESAEGGIAPDLNSLLESFNGHCDLRESNNDGFEVIYKVDFKKLPDITRCAPITIKEWQALFNKDGKIIEPEVVKIRIFRGGLENSLRKEGWKFLLHYYPWDSNEKSRIEITKQKQNEYFSMKLQWKSMNEQQKQRNNLFRDRESLIEKDVMRTDRTLEYYQGETNVHLEVLHDILMTYNMYNFDLGYVQGMNDLLSPILIVMDNEVDAFWCFVGLMDRMGDNFHMDQSHIKRQLSNLHTLLQFIDAELANYLADNNSSNMYFFFRWMLICFKREFSFQDVMLLWEVLWTNYPCKNFELLVCLAILISQKTVIMESKFGCNEILKHINDLSFKVQLEPLLRQAEGLYILLKKHEESTPGLPPVISSIMFPNVKKKKIRNPNYNDDDESDATSTISSTSSRTHSPSYGTTRTRHHVESHTINENDSAVVTHRKDKQKNEKNQEGEEEEEENDDEYKPNDVESNDSFDNESENEEFDLEQGEKTDQNFTSKRSTRQNIMNNNNKQSESEKISTIYDKSKADLLWENFKPSSTLPSITCISSKTTTTISQTVSDTIIPEKATKIYEFAGETIIIPSIPTSSSSSTTSFVPTTITSTSSKPITTTTLERSCGGSIGANALLDQLGINKKQKLSTLEKTRLDWNQHKSNESLTDELNIHRRGKDSYVEKVAFLQRADTLEYEHQRSNFKKK
ncbi:unnamed protein product [Didymodactylos carnosus]|uniref:TBC1 domain family member 15 n=1 Tax=Didymodactylos carnosus TaxID=1234261 RepID=A0A814BZX9_9BILA|nr:unnamed protein product [Didymodactylos carnosus]CAF3710830.1 unnamed protein product [Didymodactylos carnosus]